MLLAQARDQVARTCLKLSRSGLVVGTAGNVSVRVGDLVAISPSGVDYESLTPESVGVHRVDGEPVDAPLAPSSELPLHLQVHRRVAVGEGATVVHTHSPAATALSTVLTQVPASHYYTAMFGGPVRVARYAPFGSEALAQAVADALDGRAAALLAHHGAVTVATSAAAAYALAEYLEHICDVHLRALSTGLPVRALGPEELAEAAVGLRGYGPGPR
jgi:L-fuculose-phosphate aldolase